MKAKNLDRYLAAIVDEYRETDADTDFEQRQALWRAAVIIWEQAGEDNAEPWLDQLREASLGLVKPTRIESTIFSAHRRVYGEARVYGNA
jgi:hypothetical protein